MLDGQMGALMRSSLDQQGIDMTEIVERHAPGHRSAAHPAGATSSNKRSKTTT